MYTSHYEEKRSFAETRSGAFRVHVYGDWLPTSFFGAFAIVAALLRSAWLSLMVALLDQSVEVFVCDQVSICVPILRLLRPGTRILFYCHFPDMLLSKRTSMLKRVYRWPFDTLEQACTGLADAIVVNSKFTRQIFAETFRRINTVPSVLYPCINVPEEAAANLAPPQASPILMVSINRYERKKGIDVAVRAFAAMLRQLQGGSSGSKQRAQDVHLVIAGGYDTRVAENIQHHQELVDIARQEGLLDVLESSAPAIARVLQSWPAENSSGSSVAQIGYDRVQVGRHITFIRSFSDEQKSVLLSMATAILYTPQHEHFGIVPLECMAAKRPVIACASGGPLESIVDRKTGFLCQPTADSFASAMTSLVVDPSRAVAMGEEGLQHVAGHFSRDVFAAQLEMICSRLVQPKLSTRPWSLQHWFVLLLVLSMLFLPMILLAAAYHYWTEGIPTLYRHKPLG